MAIELVWDSIVPLVLHYQFQKGWTWEEFRLIALKEHSIGEALEGHPRYDIIGDLTHASVPSGTPISNVHRLFQQGPANRKMIVIVGSPMIYTLIQASGKVYPPMKSRFHGARTIEDARQLILNLRQAIVDT